MKLTRQAAIDFCEEPPLSRRWTVRGCAIFMLGLSALVWIVVGLAIF